MKHTKGPWTVALYEVTPTMLERMKAGSFHHAVCTDENPLDPRGMLVALCGDEPGCNTQSAKDAHLISAAPDILEALESLMHEHQQASGVTDERIWDKCLKATKKAKGE